MQRYSNAHEHGFAIPSPSPEPTTMATLPALLLLAFKAATTTLLNSSHKPPAQTMFWLLHCKDFWWCGKSSFQPEGITKDPEKPGVFPGPWLPTLVWTEWCWEVGLALESSYGVIFKNKWSVGRLPPTLCFWLLGEGLPLLWKRMGLILTQKCSVRKNNWGPCPCSLLWHKNTGPCGQRKPSFLRLGIPTSKFQKAGQCPSVERRRRSWGGCTVPQLHLRIV